ncbi:MAG: hypothetical protein HW416_967 [Chloroflexi bacterium]|nr:hypothetical protein [Chloroflexota bacterium]
MAGDEQVVVQKLDYSREVILSWTGQLVEATEGRWVVRAVFAPRSGNEVVVDGVALRPSDVFTEFYFGDRCYNVMHVAGPDGAVRGWYCNVALPARFESGVLSYVDLALDLFVHPDWRHTVLDADEFDDLAASVYEPADVPRARAALEDLVQMALGRSLPVP